MADNEGSEITKDMNILDIVSSHPGAEQVFKAYDNQLKTCICCEMLFEPLTNVARAYEIDLEELLERLNTSVSGR